MSDTSGSHLEAAGRHELAAKDHERAARFWDDQGHPEWADLQRELVTCERLAAQLERRRAELIDDPHGEIAASELVARHTWQGAKQTSALLMQLVNTLQRSAELAEEQAQRLEQAGRIDDAAKERQVALRAREGAHRARSQLERWLQLLGERET